ncbi:PREDICTED: uncharacterized protein LOC109170687, partial [Ipomoea nil]|uniref:uncharacterized protein LOC109170687 n=1 Tax=Ipomoea nil TaxID=35883 RepID=UPI0009019F3C
MVHVEKARDKFSMHGNARCSKHFPKRFVDSSTFDDNGYPVYRRRDNGSVVTKNGIALDNRYVVPHNRYLLLKYKAHINVEWCNQSRSIKYLFKYVNKGHDRVTAEFYKTGNDDENGKAVDEINMYYDYDDAVENIVNRPTIAQSMFLEWFEANKTYPGARELTYVEMPTRFVWKKDLRKWQPRKKGFSIGRIFYVPPATGEIFYLRGLVDDDNEYVDAIDEASHWASAEQLRRLFVTILMSSCMGKTGNSLARRLATSIRRCPIQYPYTTAEQRLIQEELSYDRGEQEKENQELVRQLTDEQRAIYNEVLTDVDCQQGGLFFVSGYGGTVLRLTKNLRLKSVQSESECKEIEEFAKWIANIGDGMIGCQLDGESEITIPEDLLLKCEDDPIATIVDSTFPNFLGLADLSYLNHNANVDMLADLHTPEFLNALRCSGVPNHALTLKVGSPVMLLRNIDHTLGLCNGTRLIVTRLADHVLEGQIMCGTNAGTR